VLSSDSARTHETWELMKKEMPGRIPVTFTAALYEASLESVRTALAAVEGVPQPCCCSATTDMGRALRLPLG